MHFCVLEEEVEEVVVGFGVSYHGGGHEEVPWQQRSQAQDEKDDAHQEAPKEEECDMLQEAG